MEANINKEEIMPSENLIPGNFESIIMLGSEAQTQLRSFSKTISEILLNENGDLDYLIHDIIKEIDQFQLKASAKSKISVLFGISRQRDLLIKQYNSVLSYIDKMTISLQLQEAQLIKDSTIIQQMQKFIEVAIIDMENSIENGEELIRKRDLTKKEDSLDDWYGRLERRLNDLKLSHTVLLQSEAQLKLMLDNNNKLIEKILSALSGTIPIWRNQLSLLLGIEKMNRNNEAQERIEKITEQFVRTNNKKVHKKYNRKHYKEIDIEKIKKTNNKLSQSLNELVAIEENSTAVRLELKNNLI